MSRQKRKRKNREREVTTFDPKIHYKKKGTTGYQMRRDYKETPEESSGAQLANILK